MVNFERLYFEWGSLNATIFQFGHPQKNFKKYSTLKKLLLENYSETPAAWLSNTDDSKDYKLFILYFNGDKTSCLVKYSLIVSIVVSLPCVL
jgi:hypothetical protein